MFISLQASFNSYQGHCNELPPEQLTTTKAVPHLSSSFWWWPAILGINTTKALQSLPVSSHGCLLSVWLSPLFIRTPIILKAGFTPLQSDRLLTNYSCNDYFLVKITRVLPCKITFCGTRAEYFNVLFFFFLKDKDAMQLTALTYSYITLPSIYKKTL